MGVFSRYGYTEIRKNRDSCFFGVGWGISLYVAILSGEESAIRWDKISISSTHRVFLSNFRGVFVCVTWVHGQWELEMHKTQNVLGSTRFGTV